MDARLRMSGMTEDARNYDEPISLAPFCQRGDKIAGMWETRRGGEGEIRGRMDMTSGWARSFAEPQDDHGARGVLLLSRILRWPLA